MAVVSPAIVPASSKMLKDLSLATGAVFIRNILSLAMRRLLPNNKNNKNILLMIAVESLVRDSLQYLNTNGDFRCYLFLNKSSSRLHATILHECIGSDFAVGFLEHPASENAPAGVFR